MNVYWGVLIVLGVLYFSFLSWYTKQVRQDIIITAPACGQGFSKESKHLCEDKDNE